MVILIQTFLIEKKKPNSKDFFIIDRSQQKYRQSQKVKEKKNVCTWKIEI